MGLLRSTLLAATGTGLALLLVLSLTAPAVHAQQAPSPSATVVVNTRILPAYDFLGSGMDEVNATVSGNLSPPNQNLTLLLSPSFNPSSAVGSVTVGGKIIPEPFQLLVTSGGRYTYSFSVPSEASHFAVTMNGTESETSFLWRYLTRVPSLSTTGLTITKYTTYVTVPSGTILSQAYSAKGGVLSPSLGSLVKVGIGQTTYDFRLDAGLLVFQSTAFLPASIAVTSIALAVVALAALNFFGSGRVLLDKTVTRILPSGGRSRKALWIPGTRPGFRLRRLFLPRKLLALFILCAFVMVAAAAIGGPDPSLKAYAIAPQSSRDGIQSSLHAVTGGNVLVITPVDDYTDFGVMSSVGQFNLVVVSNYAGPALDQVRGYVIGNLANVPVIVVDESADQNFTIQIKALYGDKVFPVTNAESLTVGEQQHLASLLGASARANSFGLRVSTSGFPILLVSEAVLSFVLIFLGWAFLGSLTSEASSQTDLSHLVTVISSGVFVFVFSEAIYVVTSSLLAYSLSLHAVISGATNITAVGLLGFGGGSTPRLAAGFLGILVGVLAVESGPRIRGTDFALVAGIVLVLLANPLVIGQFVYQGLLLFVGNFAFGAAYSSSLSFKGFLYGVGAALGGGLTPQYLLSAGKILFFAGLAPLAYLKKMGRTTTVLALLVAAVAIGDGGVRVGEMTPDKTVVAIVPGIFVGFALVGLLLAVAVAEKYVRGNWKSRA